MNTNDNLVNLLNGSCYDGIYSVVCLWHPKCGTISVDSTYSTIYVSTSEYISNVSGDISTDIYICACTDSCKEGICISGIGSTTIALCNECGYSLLRIDISQIPVNKKIVIIDKPEGESPENNCFNYDMQLQGHLHLCGYSNVCTLSPTYSNLQITSKYTSANMSGYVDYISYIPDCKFTYSTTDNYTGPLVKDSEVDLLSYGTDIEWTNGNVTGKIPIKVPKKNAICRYKKSGELDNPNDTVIDACDLPDIDIRLLSNRCSADLDPTWFYTTGDSGVLNLSTVTACLNNCLNDYINIMNGT